MRKIKFTALIALTLVAVMALSSCSIFSWFSKDTTIADLVNPDAVYEKTPIYNSAEFFAEDADNYSSYGDLFYISSTANQIAGVQKEVTNTVYNIKTGTQLYRNKIYGNNTLEDIQLKTITSFGGTKISYFVVTQEINDYEKGTKSSSCSVFDASGRLIVSFNKAVNFSQIADLVRFDTKYYRAGDNGELVFAFELPAYSEAPEVDYRSEKYYYSFENLNGSAKTLSVYDTELKLVSRYTLPNHAQSIKAAVLENETIFIQYYEEVTDYENNDYDFFIKSGTVDAVAVRLTTLIYNPKNGKTDDVDCDGYCMIELIDSYSAGETYKNDKAGVIGYALKTEKTKTYNSSYTNDSMRYDLICINKKGKISNLSLFNDERLTGIELASNDRWIVVTDESTYLVDRDFKNIIGEVGAGDIYGRFIVAGGNIYDLDLNLVYADLDGQNLSIWNTIGENLILESDDAYYFFNGSMPTVLCNKADNVDIDVFETVVTVMESIEGTTNTYLTIYNANGERIYSLEIPTSNAYCYEVALTDNAMIFKIGDDFYRFISYN